MVPTVDERGNYHCNPCVGRPHAAIAMVSCINEFAWSNRLYEMGLPVLPAIGFAEFYDKRKHRRFGRTGFVMFPHDTIRRQRFRQRIYGKGVRSRNESDKEFYVCMRFIAAMVGAMHDHRIIHRTPYLDNFSIDVVGKGFYKYLMHDFNTSFYEASKSRFFGFQLIDVFHVMAWPFIDNVLKIVGHENLSGWTSFRDVVEQFGREEWTYLFQRLRGVEAFWQGYMHGDPARIVPKKLRGRLLSDTLDLLDDRFSGASDVIAAHGRNVESRLRRALRFAYPELVSFMSYRFIDKNLYRNRKASLSSSLVALRNKDRVKGF